MHSPPLQSEVLGVINMPYPVDCYADCLESKASTLIARFMRPTWPTWTQVGPMLVPWTLLSGKQYCQPHSYKVLPCHWNCSLQLQKQYITNKGWEAAYMTASGAAKLNKAVNMTTLQFQRRCFDKFALTPAPWLHSYTEPWRRVGLGLGSARKRKTLLIFIIFICIFHQDILGHFT